MGAIKSRIRSRIFSPPPITRVENHSRAKNFLKEPSYSCIKKYRIFIQKFHKHIRIQEDSREIVHAKTKLWNSLSENNSSHYLYRYARNQYPGALNKVLTYFATESS